MIVVQLCSHRHDCSYAFGERKKRSNKVQIRATDLSCPPSLLGFPTASMGKKKKRQQTPEIHIHLHPPSEQPRRLSRRVFGSLGLNLLANVLAGLVLEPLKRFIPFLDNAPVGNDPRVVTIQAPTIGPTAQPFPPSVATVAPLRFSVSSSAVFVDSFKSKLQSAS